MSMSYFRRKAAASYGAARSSVAPHPEKEALIRPGQGFKARAITARARLDRLQKAAVAKLEAARQGKYWNSRE